MTTRKHLEDDECMALIAWRDLHVKRYPVLKLLIHIPNGGRRDVREAARLKRMGVKKGVSDFLLPVRRPMPTDATRLFTAVGGTYHIAHSGLWIEMKAVGGYPTPEQRDWIDAMRLQLFRAEVCVGWVKAAQVICDYLSIPEIAP